MHFSSKRKRCRGMIIRAAVLAIVATILIGANAFAGGIMLQIRDVPLREVVSLLMQQSGANVVIPDASVLDRKITASLNDVPLEKALDYIVKTAGVSYRKMEDGTYIIGGTQLEEPLPPIDVAVPIEPTPPPRAQETSVVVVKLMHSTPSELLRLLGWDGVNPLKNNEVNYPPFGGKDKVPTPAKGGMYLHTSSGPVYDTTHGAAVQNGYPVVPTIDPASLSPGAGRTADAFTGAAQYPTPTPGRPAGWAPGQATTPTRPGTPTTPTQATTAPTTTTGNFLWPEGIEDARPFDLDNSIIVKGTEDGIEKFKKIIRMLDVPPKQVQVKAEFVEVKTTDVKSFGIDWSLQRLNESFATAFGPTGNVVVGFATGNLAANLRTQLTSDIGTVINSPIISTINNQNAQISISTIIPYWTSMATVVGDGNIINQAYPNFISIDTQLMIQPRVNGDGTITMILQPQVSDTGAVITGPDGSTIPEQRTQQLFTQRRVANGETIVVGGFIRKNDSSSTQKIPILGDLPIVGSLFRTVNKTTEDRELLIFITPTIIPSPGGGSAAEIPIP